MLVGKAAILFVSSAFFLKKKIIRLWMWAVVKSCLLICSREDLCSTRMIASWCCHDWKRKLIYGVPLFPLYYTHTHRLYIKKKNHCCTWPLLHFCLQPFQIIPVVIIRGHEGVLLGAEIQKRWMRIYGSTLGCYYYLCQAGYVSVCVVFIVIIGPFLVRYELQCVVGMNVFLFFLPRWSGSWWNVHPGWK